jgi:glyoxylase I family protein
MTVTKQDVEEVLMEKEMGIVAAQQRGDRAAVEAVLDDHFCEIGSSGRLFSRAELLEAIGQIKIVDYSFERFQVLAIDEQHAIVTYIAKTRRRYHGEEHTVCTYRSSTWKAERGGWRMIFHQGTPLG